MAIKEDDLEFQSFILGKIMRLLDAELERYGKKLGSRVNLTKYCMNPMNAITKALETWSTISCEQWIKRYVDQRIAYLFSFIDDTDLFNVLGSKYQGSFLIGYHRAPFEKDDEYMGHKLHYPTHLVTETTSI